MKTERLTIRMTKGTAKQIRNIRMHTKATTDTNAVTYALIIANWVLEEQSKGNEIVTRKAGRSTNPRELQAVVKFIFG